MIAVFDLTNNPELRTLTEEKMRRQMFWGNRFASWIGEKFVKAGGAGGEEVYSLSQDTPKWTGAPIETVNAFIQKGRTDMLIPVRNRLTGRPTFGGNQLFGKGEPPAYSFRSVFINRTRKSYSPPTGMELQKTKQWATSLVDEARGYMSTWLSDYVPENLLAATFFGYSSDLLSPASAGGRAVATVSHPNFFIAGQGQVTYANGRPGTAGYEGSVETALDSLVGNANGGMTCRLIRNLVFEAARLKIKPITLKSGFEFYPVWLKDSQWLQLQADPEFQSLAKSLHIADLDKHPLGNGMVAYFGGAVIYNDLRFWSARTHLTDATVTAGTVEYGPTPTTAERNAGFYFGNTITQLDTGSRALGVLVGQSMLSVGTGQRLKFEDQAEDFGNHVELGLEMIQSWVRNETYDTIGFVPGLNRGDFYENTSSLVFATNTPYALQYA